MPVINILSPHVADMIAAGEVVERPASVIKELVENSFDAGAGSVTVEIRHGGATYIRVTDDGCGMSPEDAGVAFLRHATSKLKGERDLESISTMGFRGEALAAISSVSRITLTTRPHDAPEGIRVELEAGDIISMDSCGCPAGTTIIVRDLFYNTPARQKFLKSDRSEASSCGMFALRCAIGRPDVSLRFIRDGVEEFFSPGNGKADACIYSLFGRDFANGLIPCSGTDEGVSVSGFISSPSAVHGNRAKQYFYCNGRFIRSQLLQSALEQAYKNSLLTGRYPACVLYLTLSFGSVDVNVHPAKTEVKFSDEKHVFDCVYYSVLAALGGESITAKVSIPSSSLGKASSASGNFSASSEIAPVSPEKNAVSPENPAVASDNGFFRSMSGAEFRSSFSAAPDSGLPSSRPVQKAGAEDIAFPVHTSGSHTSSQYLVSRPDVENIPQRFAQSASSIAPIQPFSAQEEARQLEIVENNVQNVEISPVPRHKIVGELFKTYIVVEQNDEVVLIDKHAAHERIIFDRLKAREGDISSQMLLLPATLRLSGEDSDLLEQNGELLLSLGFEIEPYGDGNYVIRAVPADMDAGQAESAVEEICEALHLGKSDSLSSPRDEILHTVACKAAIKAGWDSDVAELEKLVSAVLSGEVKYCPHGRPVSTVLTKTELEKSFKRIV